MRRIFTGVVTVLFLWIAPSLSCFVFGIACQTASCLVAGIGAGSQAESQFFNHLLNSIARQAWTQAGKSLFDWQFWIAPSFRTSWVHNRDLLSQIPAHSDEEKELLLFLQQRWLAKISGFYPFEINWLCPFFGIHVQTHPETTNCYARDPSRCSSKTYRFKVDAWKKVLPHPRWFPLILTRPADLAEYLPNCWVVPPDTTLEALIQQIQERVPLKDIPLVVDLTNLLPTQGTQWRFHWKVFSQLCKKHPLDLSRVICIQRVQEKAIGAIRILPLESPFSSRVREQHQYLSEWISRFGLTASRVELDRSFLNLDSIPNQKWEQEPILETTEFLSTLTAFEKSWISSHPQKNLMVSATLQLLKGLVEKEVHWEKVSASWTKRAIATRIFSEIRQQMDRLLQEEAAPLFNIASRVEQIHSSISALLEICEPFAYSDFSTIYHDLPVTIPSSLKPLAHFSLHASGMTSLAGILKAAQKQAGSDFRVLYGENSYFEAVQAVRLVSHAISTLEATEEDWKRADLILTQFNPVLKRDAPHFATYKLEQTVERLHQIFETRQERPLTLVIDSTIDFIDSLRVRQTLELFRKEIEQGILNIVCFRSGLKFDLFGMDHCSGSPFWMIHNANKHWDCFHSLLREPALQADSLSLNWFCLNYKYVAPELDLYRKQIFANTRALLHQIPAKLYDPTSFFQVTPMDEQIDPAFIEVRVRGPFHSLRASAILGGCLYLRCLQLGVPIFCRRSIGFFHANFGLLFGDTDSSARLTVGLDPSEIPILSTCFHDISNY